MVRLRCVWWRCNIQHQIMNLRWCGSGAFNFVFPRNCAKWKFEVSISRHFWCAAIAGSRKFQRNCYFWFCSGISPCQLFAIRYVCVSEFWSAYVTVWLRINIVYSAFCVSVAYALWSMDQAVEVLRMQNADALKRLPKCEEVQTLCYLKRLKCIAHCTWARSFSSRLFLQIHMNFSAV